MGKTVVVRQDKLLALDIDIIDVVAVDDERPANTNELVSLDAQLLMDHGLNLTQLEGELTHIVVGLHQIAIVAVRGDEDNPVGCYAHQITGG